jgi:DNA polymerase V
MSHGGKRINAGRPKGMGKYGEPTVPMRVPESRVEAIQKLIAKKNYNVPLYSSSVQAGSPSPADDNIEGYLDLNEHLIPNATSTFMVRAKGESMQDIGIYSGDILIVDRSITPSNNKIVVAAINGELTVKRLVIKNSAAWLMPENKNFKPINISGQDTVIWGVVTSVIHQV